MPTCESERKQRNANCPINEDRLYRPGARRLGRCSSLRSQGLSEALTYLAENLHHPSLRAKKYDEARDLWQARVTKDWRFYFKIMDDTYRLENIKKHPKK
jgi:hypothetical protein